MINHIPFTKKDLRKELQIIKLYQYMETKKPEFEYMKAYRLFKQYISIYEMVKEE